ncbi:MAG: putative Iron dicitrate transrane sensor FecR [Nitrospira sp.]|nr:putative Iron dicitrate transrane sensor FecR [Nitrospira sp.]
MREWPTHPSQGYTLVRKVAIGAPLRESFMTQHSEHSMTSRPGTGQDGSDQALAWFARLRSGRMSANEQAAFESWLDQHPAHERAFREIDALWEDPELFHAAIEIDGKTSYAAQSPSSWHRLWPRILAGAAVVLLVTAVALFQWDIPLRLRSDYVTATGERHTLLLADQSTVILNTRSAVATAYKEDIRRVTLLKGEALFRVEPDKTRPFIVEYHGVMTKAVGTSFLLRERQDELYITVLEGVVQVGLTAHSDATISLTAGQQARVVHNGITSVHSVNADAASAWVQGRLMFDNIPFSEVLEEIARYHSGYVGLWNQTLAPLRVSGTYNLADTAHILTTLTQTFPVHMRRLTDRFVVFR